MYNYSEIVNNTWIMEGLCMKTLKRVEKEVRVTGILDGPGSDRRDYCTIEGWYDWEIDIPLENLLKQARIKKDAA